MSFSLEVQLADVRVDERLKARSIAYHEEALTMIK